MSKQVATPKQTGGGGFAFEDLVGAWFLLGMLRAERMFGDSFGAITRVSFQKRVDGWLLDDLVLDLAGVPANAKVALSIKSNVQLTDSGFPTEFVSDAWEQSLTGDPFDINRDLLSLAAAPAERVVSSAWGSLASKAATADEDQFETRMAAPHYASQTERDLFASLACPTDVAQGKTSADTVRLLRRIRYLEFDFGTPTSERTASALAKCRDALRSPGDTEAKQLWDTLQLISRNYRTSGGDLSLQSLADQLRSDFDLTDYPDHRADWEKILASTNALLDQVADSLAGKTKLQLSEQAPPADHRFLAIVGVSGSGKSAAAKQLLSEHHAGNTRIWLTPDDLNSASPATLLPSLGLRHAFLDLLREATAQSGVLVIDAAEKLDETGISNLRSVLAAARVGDSRSPWRLVLTCTLERWSAVAAQIIDVGSGSLQPHVHALSFDFQPHCNSVCEDFPHLSALLRRPDIAQLCSNLKILDLLLRHASASVFDDSPVGETAVCDWFWQEVLSRQDDAAASGFAQKLACYEADNFSDGVAVTSDGFDSGDRQVGSRLKTNGLLTVRDERFRFEHDLLGDWSRARYLLSQPDAATAIADKAPNPRWHRAIRLLGLRLIETTSQGITAWLELHRRLTENGSHSAQSDLLLDSVVLSADASSTLESVWEHLVANNGELLRRLLGRFLYVATTPDPRIGEVAHSSLAASWRMPYWPLWPATLEVIDRHRTEAISAAAVHVSEIAHKWLMYTPGGVAWRRESARLLLECSEQIIRLRQSEGWAFDDDAAKLVFGRLPIATEEAHEETVTLLQRLVEREADSPFKDEFAQAPPTPTPNPLPFAGLIDDSNEEMAPPWEIGPLRAVESCVSEALLGIENPLLPLFRITPDDASEILLALLIREPLPVSRPDWLAYDPVDELVDVNDVRDWSPPMYFRGPFLSWLQVDTPKALDIIITLVDFATARWLELQTDPPDEISLELDGLPKVFRGGVKVWSWHRDWPGTNEVIASALMALEKWLYDHAREPDVIGPIIDRLLAESESVAFLGVLCSLGKYRQDYFRQQLRPLVSAWRLVGYDIEHQAQRIDSLHCSGLGMLEWQREGRWMAEQAYDWHSLKHRSRKLMDPYTQLMLTDEDFQNHLVEVRSTWSQELKGLATNREQGLLRTAIAQLDPTNWSVSQKGDELHITYNEPTQLAQDYAAERQTLDNRMADINLPYLCRELLDNRKRLEPNQLEPLWSQLKRIAEEYRKGKSEEPWRLVDRLMGGIAVLERLHADWLEEDPARIAWCDETIVFVCSNPPPPSPFSVPEAIGGHGWRNFLAFIIVPEFAVHPSDENLRCFIADLMFSYEFSVAKDIMDLAFEHQVQLGEEFVRLQRLLIEVSGVREVHRTTQGGNSIWHTPDPNWDINKRFNELSDQFVKQAMPASRPQLSEVVASTNQEIFDIVSRARSKSSKGDWPEETQQKVRSRIDRLWGFEAGLIQAGFSWLHEATNAVNTDDEVIDILTELIEATLRPLGDSQQAHDDEDDHNNFYAQPRGFGDWVIELTTQVLPYISDADKAARLWTPFLSLGLDRKHWVERFLSSWCLHGPRVEGCLEQFIATWRAMMAFAWSADAWQATGWRSRRDRETLFRHLMGFGLIGFLPDDDHLDSITSSCADEFQQWADEFLDARDAFVALCELLNRPVQQHFLRTGLQWMSQHISTVETLAWDDEGGITGWIVRLFDDILNRRRIDLSLDSESRECMLIVTRKMADRQHASAMVLQERIAKSK